jgi:hypothetical protein
MTEEEQRTATQKAAAQPGGILLDSLVLSRSPLTFWHKLLGRLPSSYRQLDAAVDALSERVLEGDPSDVPADVRQLAERVRWAVLTLR